MAWTNIPNASGTSYTNVPNAAFSSVSSGGAGQPIGLLLALTYATDNTVVTDPWTKITNASGTGWTNIPNAV